MAVIEFGDKAFVYAGLAFAALVACLHLIRVRRVRSIPWGAMDLLARAYARRRRTLRLRESALLGLRVLAVLLVSLAAARTTLRDSPVSLPQSRPVAAVVLVDNSLSMGWRGPAGTLLNLARREIVRYLSELPAGSRAAVVPLCGPAQNRAAFVPAAEAVQVLEGLTIADRSSGRAEIRNAFARVRALPGGLSAAASLWTDAQLALHAEDIPSHWPSPVAVIRLGPPQADNAWIERLEFPDGAVEPGGEAPLVAEVRCTGRPRQVQATLLVDGHAVAVQPVALAPDRPAAITFVHRWDPRPAGASGRYTRVELRLPPDHLSADNRRLLLVPVVANATVVVVQERRPHENPSAGVSRGAAVLARLFTAPGGDAPGPPLLRLQVVHPAELNRQMLEEAALVIVEGADLLPAQAAELLEYVRQGGQLWYVAAADRADLPAALADAWRELLPGVPKAPAVPAWQGRREKAGTGRPAALDQQSLDPALFALPGWDNASASELWSEALVSRVLHVSDVHEESLVHARLETGQPLLLSRPVGRGRTWLWATTLDSAWNSLCRTRAVLLFDRLVRRALTARWPARVAEAGATLAWHPPEGMLAARVVLHGPDASRQPLLAVRRGTHWRLALPAQRGFYRLQAFAGEDRHQPPVWSEELAVNGPSSESALVALSRPTGAGHTTVHSQIVETTPDDLISPGQRLWPWLLVLALAALSAEQGLGLAARNRRQIHTATFSRASGPQPAASQADRSQAAGSQAAGSQAAGSQAAVPHPAVPHATASHATAASMPPPQAHLALLPLLFAGPARGVPGVSLVWQSSWGGTCVPALCLAALAAALAMLVHFRLLRQAGRRRKWALAAARAVAAAGCTALPFNPVLRLEWSHATAPHVVVLCDATESMALDDEPLPDAPGPTQPAANGMASSAERAPTRASLPRIVAARRLLAEGPHALLPRLQRHFNVSIYSFGGLDGLKRLDPASPVWQAAGHSTRLGAALEELERLPEFAQTTAVVIISDFDQNAGPAPVPVARRLGLPLFTVGVGRSAQQLPPRTELASPPRRSRKLLWVEYEPTWEWRFAVRALARGNDSVQVRSFVRSVDPQVRESDPRWVASLALPRAELLGYDVIVLGDVPASMLSSHFTGLVRELVVRFGGGLVVACGPRFGPAQLSDTPLAELVPVEAEPGSRRADAVPYEPRLTPHAKTHAFGLPLCEAEQGGKRLEFEWYHPLAAVAREAEVLAVHPRARTTRSAHALPLLAVARAGRGRVVWLGVAETWRLRRASPELHVRFWSELAAWAGEEHVRWLSGRLSLRADRAEYTAGDQALLFIEAYDASFRPLAASAAGALQLELVPPAGTRPQQVGLAYQQPGRFTARVRLSAAGDYLVRVREGEAGDYAAISLRAWAASPERRGSPRRQDVQLELARATQGRSYTRHTAADLVDDLPRRSRERLDVREWPLAHQWPVYLLLIGLLFCDWNWRR